MSNKDPTLKSKVIVFAFQLCFHFEEDLVVAFVRAGAKFFFEFGSLNGLDDEVVIWRIEIYIIYGGAKVCVFIEV